MKTIQVQNYICKVGGNAKENWVLLKESDKNDFFFHLSSFPSCYVVLPLGSVDAVGSIETVEESVLLECARICLQNTKYRDLKDVDVDCTRIANVRRGGKVGEVYYANAKKVRTFRVS